MVAPDCTHEYNTTRRAYGTDGECDACRMQIQLLSDAVPKLQRKQSIYAIHGPNAATELAMLATLQGMDAASLPALPALLSCKPSAAAVNHSRQAADTGSTVESGTLDPTSGERGRSVH